MAASDERESGWWVYCIVAADRELPGHLSGLSSADPPVLIEEGNVAAIASRVPLDEFGEAPLRANLNDLAWLERTVRAHESVLDAMLPGGALVPMRVCTIYSDEAQVREMLDARGALFDHVLAGLAGKAEWGMKIVADRARLTEQVRARSEGARALEAESAGKPAGGAYLARKKIAALVRDESDRLLDHLVREAHARMAKCSESAVVLPAQNRELAGYSGDMVFNGAYLVDDEQVETVTLLVDELRSEYGPLGVAFDLTGPWPAYNFSAPAPPREVRA
jgi:hypothetical protein